MITVRVIGGMGNQLFQYSLARSLFIKDSPTDDNQPILFRLDISGYKLYKLHGMMLDKLNIKGILIDSNSNPYNLIYHEKTFNFDERVFDIKGNTYFHGYWQSEKYFKDIRDVLLEEITPKEKMDLSIIPNSASIHVRRKDYLIHNKVYNCLNVDYYKNAIDVIGQDKDYFIFSDDINWCRDNFNFIKNVKYVEGQSNISDFFNMSRCEDNIIANSSFSWWAAWINKNKDKKVIAPKTWFINGTPEHDLVPEEWIKI